MRNGSPRAAAPSVVPDDVELFPYAIVRIGGGSFDDLLAMEVDRDGNLLTDLRAAGQELETARAALGEEIFSAIGGCTDAAVRRALLAAKRDLFNGRRNSMESLRQLPAVHLPSLSRYEDAAAMFDVCRRTFESTFLERQSHARRLLQDLASSEAFQKPLMLSSRTLLDELSAYLNAPADAPSAKQLHIERAILKYITRAHAKTSPFSTFGHLALATTRELGGAIWTFDDSIQFHSHVRISSSHWLRLRPLVLAIPGITDHVRVRANPTLEHSAEGHRYLRSRWNVEAFQTMPPFDELTRIADLAADSPTFKVLAQRVTAAEAVEGNEDDVRAFLDRLIAEGFLEFDTGISGTDPDWDLSLIALALPLASECAAAFEIVEGLRYIREELRSFATAGLTERQNVMKRCHARMAGLRELLAASGSRKNATQSAVDGLKDPAQARSNPYLEQQHFLYEDSATGEPAIQIDSSELTAIVGSLSTVARYLTFIGGDVERMQLAHYCVAKYGESVVPLVRVYEDYYRDCKVPEQRHKLESPSTETPMPLDYPGAAAFQAAMAMRSRRLSAWISAIADRIRVDGRASHERVDITVDDLIAASAFIQPGYEPPLTGGSVFIQLVPPAGNDSRCLGVVNGVAPGHGKTMSRFLDMFPEEVTALVRSHNRKTASSVRLVEVQDASVSNADMHPPLLDFEISSPGSQTSFPPEQQIPVADLSIAVSESAHTPPALIRSSTGERIEVVDLGFVGLAFRSQLLRLLVQAFSPSKHIGFYPLLQAATAAAKAVSSQPPGITSRPRVVFGDRLVLQRRSWVVGIETVPAQRSAESDAEFYRRINDWRETSGLPAHVFVYLTRDREPDRKKGTKLSKDDYKPQFISFYNWLTVSLFDRMRARATDPVLIEEMLPDGQSMPCIGGRRYPVEFILQWSPRVP